MSTGKIWRDVFAGTSVLAAQRQVRIRVSTEEKGRDDLVVRSAGIDFTDYLRNPVVLFSHDPKMPIARCVTIGQSGGGAAVEALTQYPPEGVSARSDEAFGLIQAGVLCGVSMGFNPTASEPLDPRDPSAGRVITRCTCMEISMVSIPAVPSALVLERTRQPEQPRSFTPAQVYDRLLARIGEGPLATRRTPEQERRYRELMARIERPGPAAPRFSTPAAERRYNLLLAEIGEGPLAARGPARPTIASSGSAGQWVADMGRYEQREAARRMAACRRVGAV